jgi:hypothetical protein
MSEVSLESLVGGVRALRERVQLLEDREAIHRRTREYMQAKHDAHWEDAVACFADDASPGRAVFSQAGAWLSET